MSLKLIITTIMVSVLTIVIVQTPPAMAQNANFDPAEWTKVCDVDPNSKEGKKICFVTRDVRDPRGLLVGQAGLGFAEGAAPKQLSILVPLPLAISPGIAVKVDANDIMLGKIAVCAQAGCFAEVPVKEDIVQQMKAGNNMVVMFKSPPPKVEQVSYVVSLKGFTAAFDGEGTSKATLSQQAEQLDKRMLEIAEKKRQELLERARNNASDESDAETQ